MKTKLFFSVLFICLISLTAFAQTVASTAGIAVQGIARDSNNTARVNQNVSLTFLIYYLNGPNEATVLSQTETVTTDAFGVFSHILNPAPEQNAVIANFNCFLRISEGQLVVTDEALKAVPYAIAASNGVPTGSIMPFVGTTAPPGWVICDGQDFSSMPGSEALSLLLGQNTTPDLRAMFLRGSGTNGTFNTNINASLNTSHGDNTRAHSHSVNINTSFNGSHSHVYSDRLHGNNSTLGLTGSGTSGAETNTVFDIPRTTNSAGNHNHSVNGNTGNTGQLETRPMHYVVNYIIKL